MDIIEKDLEDLGNIELEINSSESRQVE